MTKMRTKFFVIFALVSFALITFSAFMYCQEEEKEKEERFTGNVIGWSGPIAGRTARLTVVIKHWATPEERQQLVKALEEGGSDGLLKAIRKTTVGYMWFTNTLRWELNFASTFQTEKGRLVRLVTERPLTAAEFRVGTPRSRDYEFGIIEFVIDEEKGKGEGVIIPLAMIEINKEGKIEIETLGTGPQKLRNVKKTK